MLDLIRQVVVSAREAAGLSQAELASRASLTQAQVSEFENGRRALDLPVLERLMGELDLALMPIPRPRVDDVRAILDEEGLAADTGAPSPLTKFGHLLD